MKKQTVRLTESQIRNIVKTSIRESLINEKIDRAVNSVINEMMGGFGEPEEIVPGAYLTGIQFNGDGSGSIDLSFDPDETEPDGDAYRTDFELDADRLDVLLNNQYAGDRLHMGYPEDEKELARCVRLYRNDSYMPEFSQALRIAIVKRYLEQRKGGLSEETKKQREKDPMNQWFKDMDRAQTFRDTMDYIFKGGKIPNKK